MSWRRCLNVQAIIGTSFLAFASLFVLRLSPDRHSWRNNPWSSRDETGGLRGDNTHNHFHPFSDAEMEIGTLDEWISSYLTFKNDEARQFWLPWLTKDHERQSVLKTMFEERAIQRKNFTRRKISEAKRRRKRSMDGDSRDTGPITVLLLDGAMYWPILDSNFQMDSTQHKDICPGTPCRALKGASDALRNSSHIMVAHLDGARFNYAGAAPPKHLQPLKALLTMEPGPFADPGAMKSRFTNIDFLISWSRYSEIPVTYYDPTAWFPPSLWNRSALEDMKEMGLVGSLHPITELHQKIWEKCPPWTEVSESWLRGEHPPFVTRIGNCGAQPRATLVAKLQEVGLPVQNLVCWANDAHGLNIGRSGQVGGYTYREADNIKLYSNYKFSPALESYVMLDYATEKIEVAHLSGSLPVVITHPKTAAEHSPGGPGSYLNALERTPEELGRYMQELLKDTAAYDEYFQWRLKTAVTDGWERRKRLAFVRDGGMAWVCRLCEMYKHYWDFED